MFVPRYIVFVLLLTALAAGSQAVSKSDADRCRERAGLDACYDAIRREPRDPSLLVALGDTAQRANRSAEAARAYRRAQTLSPGIPGIAAKIHAADAKAVAKPVTRKPVAAKVDAARPLATVAALQGASGRRFTNSDPVAQSH